MTTYEIFMFFLMPQFISQKKTRLSGQLDFIHLIAAIKKKPFVLTIFGMV